MTTLVPLAASSPSPLWFATRAGGTVALVLLTATVALGIAVGGRYTPRRMARFEITALHRNLSVMTLVFLALHIVTSIADPFVSLGPLVAIVPFNASYRPLWLGLGTVAFDLMLAVAITSAVRLRMGHTRWKQIHWLGYASWPVAIFHAAGTGTDTKMPLQLLLYAACLAAVAGAVGWRLYRAGPESGTVRMWGGVATVAVPGVLAAFLFFGPLQAGWAHRAQWGAAPVTGPAPAPAATREAEGTAPGTTVPNAAEHDKENHGAAEEGSE